VLAFLGNPALAISWAIAVIVGLTIHEYAHAKRAQLAGDPTPEHFGRVTLNPLAHWDLIGTTMMLLFRVGWGKPVPINPLLMRRPRYDNLMTSAWGAFANLIAVVVFGLAIRLCLFLERGLDYLMLLNALVMVNLIFAFFNLLPIYPLDGSHILVSLLPLPAAQKLELFYHRFGMLLLILVVVSGVAWMVISIPMSIIYTVLTGIPLHF